MKNNQLTSRIKEALRTVPDFPKKDILFQDISGIFQDVQLSKDIIAQFAKQADGKVDVVCGIESRGFIFGFPIALALDVPFVLVRKKGKLPPPTLQVEYDLEYGSAELEVIEGQIKPNKRVMIHDDVLATGGTASACAELVEKMGATVNQFSFLLELEALHGRNRLTDQDIVSLVTIP